MSKRVGGQIGALCGKCGDVWHVVVAVSDGRIAQVECRQCDARHRYRPGDGETQDGPAARPRRVAARRAPSKKSVVEADLSRPSRPFQMSDVYQVGDRVVHARFGKGVVQALTGLRKVEILFATGPKILAHGRD